MVEQPFTVEMKPGSLHFTSTPSLRFTALHFVVSLSVTTVHSVIISHKTRDFIPKGLELFTVDNRTFGSDLQLGIGFFIE